MVKQGASRGVNLILVAAFGVQLVVAIMGLVSKGGGLYLLWTITSLVGLLLSVLQMTRRTKSA